MTSASLEIWEDTGYTEGCLEVPKTSSTLSNPDYSFEGLEISTSSLFSEVKVKGAFAALFNCSYLRMTYDMNNGSDVSVYGWIDNVAVGSDSAGSPMTRIQWHVDLWRTYISKVTLGSGIVKRRTAEGTLPTQPYGNRYSLAKTPHDILPDSSIRWVLLNLTQTVATTEGSSFTSTTTCCYPVNVAAPTAPFIGQWGEKTITFPTWEQTITGLFDELFGIDPDAIFGAFISPVPPASATFSQYVTLNGWNVQPLDSSGSYSTGAFVSSTGYYATQSFTTLAQTTDITAYVITDMDRAPIGTLPWGISVSGGSYRLVNCDTTMYLKIWFTGSVSGATFSDGSQPVNGLEYLIPLKTLGVTTNAKSSYTYSGQQELDRQQMAIQREQALQSGLANIGNQAVQGAMGGAMVGTIAGGPAGAAGGAVIGAVTSAIGGTISTISDYHISGAANDKMMDATIRQKAQQTSHMTLPSAGQDWVYYGHSPQLIPLQWDDYSITQRSQDMVLYGAHVDEPRTSCQSLLTAGGPLQIANCTVLGSVPVQAKRYIKERLSNGVRIV